VPPEEKDGPNGPLEGDETKTGPKHARPPTLDRRRFLVGLGAGLGLSLGAAGAAAYVLDDKSPTRSRPRSSPTTTSTEPAAPGTGVHTVRLDSGVEVPVADWVVDENSRPGTLDWVVAAPPGSGHVEGYADVTSAAAGSTVTLFVDTSNPTFHVEAYRMGYYGGSGGRLIWRSPEVPGIVQPKFTLAPGVNMVSCPWQPSASVAVDATWPPGDYLLKLVGGQGAQAFVPLCVRDDASTAAFVVVNAVTTWQAYNRWGGYSLYYGPGNNSKNRARVVSFDRPYDYAWAWGAADFVGNEFPVVHLVERLGLDVTYRTDVDLHVDPANLLKHRCMITLGHDEYWSTVMRDGVTAARDHGVNLAFLGANACYRHIRFEPSATGPNRHQVCYKTDYMRDDPLWGVDPAEVTANWATGPVARPEQDLIGASYADQDGAADMVVVDAGSWLFAGTGLKDGSHLPMLVSGEFDRYRPSYPGPRNVRVLAHSPVANRGPGSFADMTYYSAPSGAGVLDVGTASWVNMLFGASMVPAGIVRSSGKVDPNAPTLERLMENVFSVFGAGPAGASYPSTANWSRWY
jgi:hypothetical protein